MFTNVYTPQITGLSLLFNAQIKHVLNYFALEITAVIVARRRHAENRERVVEGRGFVPHIFRKQEEHIVQTYLFPKPCYFSFATVNKSKYK